MVLSHALRAAFTRGQGRTLAPGEVVNKSLGPRLSLRVPYTWAVNNSCPGENHFQKIGVQPCAGLDSCAVQPSSEAKRMQPPCMMRRQKALPRKAPPPWRNWRQAPPAIVLKAPLARMTCLESHAFATGYPFSPHERQPVTEFPTVWHLLKA